VPLKTDLGVLVNKLHPINTKDKPINTYRTALNGTILKEF